MFNKEFWKFFANTFKESGWLIIKYVITAVYLFVSSIIANKMHLDNLTYFNAIIGLSALGTLIGFGISNGFGVFVNQNINNKERINHYIKVGLYLNIIFSLLLIIILYSLYYPILHQVLNLPSNLDYTFYFLMLVFIFLNCILSYLTNCLKALKLFYAQAIISVIECVLIVGGFLLVWLSFDLSLILIPFIYIAATLVNLIFACLVLNRKVNINLLKFVKLKLNKKVGHVVLTNTATEIIWQVGFTILAYFLLNVNVVLFNQYSYFENVLNVFSGIFFAFVIVTSINICRSLGEGNFDKAFKIGKNSLLATGVIWFFYFILSMGLGLPLISGMNVDIRSQAYVSLFLYVVLCLFRFLSWNLFTYILYLGGKVRVIIWQEIASTAYYITFFLLSSFMPSNIFLLYGIISIPPILQTAFGLYLFFKKKWMIKLSPDEQIYTDDNQIKVVVFDFDDTLYSGCDWEPWRIFCKKGLREMFKDLNDNDYKNLIKQCVDDGFNDSAVVKIMKKNGRDVNIWLNYRDENECNIDYTVCDVVDNEEIKKFAEKYTLYIVSNSTIKSIRQTCKLLNIDLNPFKEVIVNMYVNGMSKKDLYEDIIAKEHIKPSQMYVIGNSKEADIDPALEIGSLGKVVKDAGFKLSDFEELN